MSSEISKSKFNFLSKEEIVAIETFFAKSSWQQICEFSSGVLIEELPAKGFSGFFRSLLSKKRYLLLMRQKPESDEWLVFLDLEKAKKRIIEIIKEAECLSEVDSSFLRTTTNPSERFREISDYRIKSILSRSVSFDQRIRDLMIENNNLLTLRGQIDASVNIEWAVARVFREASIPLPEVSPEAMSFISSLSVPVKNIRSIAVEQFVLLINQKKVDSLEGAIRHVGDSLEKIEDYFEKTFRISETVSDCLQEQIAKYLASYVNGSGSFLKTAGEILHGNFDHSEDIQEIIRICLFKNYVGFFKEKFSDIQETTAWTVLSKSPSPTPLSNAGEQYFYELLDDSVYVECRGLFRFPTLIIRTDSLNIEFSPQRLRIRNTESQREGSYSDVFFSFTSLKLTQFGLNKRGKHQTGMRQWRYLKKDLTKNLRYKNNEYVDIYEFCSIEIRLKSKMIAYMIVDGRLEGVKKLFSEFLEELKIISDFLNGRSGEKLDTHHDTDIEKTIPKSLVKETWQNEREEEHQTSKFDNENTSEYLGGILEITQRNIDESSKTETATSPKNQDKKAINDIMKLKRKSGLAFAPDSTSEYQSLEPESNRYTEDADNDQNYREKLISKFNELSSTDFKTDDYADLSESALITLLLFELASSDLSTKALDRIASFREVLKEEHDSLFRNVLDSTYSKLFLSSNLLSSVTFSDRVKLLLKEYPLGKDLLDSIMNNEAELFVRNYETYLVKLPLADAVEQELRSVSNLLSISDEPRKHFEESLLQRILNSLDNSMKGNRNLLSSIKTLTSDPSNSWIKRRIIEYFDSQPMPVRESTTDKRRLSGIEKTIPNSPVKEESLDKPEEKHETSECVYEKTPEYSKEILGAIQKHIDESSNTETTASPKNQGLENFHGRLAEEPGNDDDYREKLISKFNELSSTDFKTDDYADLSESALITLLLFELASSDLSTKALDKMASFREVLKEEHDSLFKNVLNSTYSKLFLSSNLLSSVTFSNRVKLLLKEYPLGKDLLDSIINNEAELFVRNYETYLVKLPLADAVEQELRSVSNLLSISDEPRKHFEESLLQRILNSLDNSMKDNRTLLSSIETLTSDPSDSWLKRRIIEYFDSQSMVVGKSSPDKSRLKDAEEQIAEINLGTSTNILSICLSESNEIVYSALGDGSIISTKLSTGSVLRTVSGQESEGISVMTVAEGFLVSGHENGVLRIWNKELNRLTMDSPKRSSKIIGLSYSSQTRTLISCSNEGEIQTHVFSNGSFVELKALKRIDCLQNIKTFYMDWENERIIVGDAEKIRGYSMNGETLFDLEVGSSVSSIIRTHSEEFAAGTEDGNFLFLDVKRQRILAKRKIYYSPLSLHFDSDKRSLICTCKEGRVLIVDLDSRKVSETIYVELHELTCSVTVSDGGTILVGTRDGSLLLLESPLRQQKTNDSQMNDRFLNGNHEIRDNQAILLREDKDKDLEPDINSSFNHIPFARICSEEDQADLGAKLRNSNEDEHSMDLLKSALESFSLEEKRIIKLVMRLDRGNEYSLSNLRINQLQLMRVMPKLSCDSGPLIEIVERDSRYLVWGRRFSSAFCREISDFVLSEREVDNGQEDDEALQKDIQ